MYRIIVSDVHLGWEESNASDFTSFLSDYVMNQNPDELILAGDIIELWRRGITSILLEQSGVISKIDEVHHNGIDVIMLAGNHDWRFIESDGEGSVISEKPWQFTDQYSFTDQNTDFTVVHGHKADSFNDNDRQNESLCITDDERSNTINSIYNTIISKSFTLDILSKRPPLVSRPNLGSLRSLSNPGYLSEPENIDYMELVEKRMKRMYSGHVIAGHTHNAKVEDGYANCGSWSGNRNTFIEVKDGKVKLKEFEA